MLEKETQHFPRRIRTSRIGVGAGGTASRPCVASTMNVPAFGDRPPAGVGKDGAGIGMAVGHSAAKHPRCRTRRFGGLLENPVAVVGMHRGVAIAMLGPDFSDASRHLISQLDRVLKGAKPGDLPFESPTKFDLRINLRTASGT